METTTMDFTKNNTSPWLTVDQARQIAECGAKLLYREIRAGRFRAARIGNRRDLRIHRTWVDEWLEASAAPIEVRR
jgi:excisionase family DNA binding protein